MFTIIFSNKDLELFKCMMFSYSLSEIMFAAV